MSAHRTITLGASVLALTVGSLVSASANAATVEHKPAKHITCECADSWVVTVKPPAPGTNFIQSERDRLMQKAVNDGYEVSRVGQSSFIVRDMCYRKVMANFRYDDAVAAVELHDADRK